MKKYNYNERLIEKLNIIPFIERELKPLCQDQEVIYDEVKSE